jgi:hypothetical protein
MLRDVTDADLDSDVDAWIREFGNQAVSEE